MCGIIFKNNKITEDEISFLEHRGLRYNEYSSKNFSLGVWRLPTMDLSQDADQPYVWRQYVIGFNGNIYNHLSLREILLKNGYRFKTNSDTETLLKWFHYCRGDWNKFFRNLDGDYSFVIVDTAKNKAFIAVDPLSFKQLYYAFTSQSEWIFSSECKPILANFVKIFLYEDYLQMYKIFRYCPYEITPFYKVYKVPQTDMFVLNLNTGSIREIDRPDNLSFKVSQYTELRNMNIEEAAKVLRKKIIETIKLRALTDQKIVIPLSGGIDSSIITKVCADSGIEVNAINVRFRGYDYDESEFAEVIAEDCDIPLHKVNISLSRRDLVNFIYYYENFADKGGVVPEFLLHKAIKKSSLGITVLSGDPADELFGGYKRILANNREELIRKFLVKYEDLRYEWIVDKWISKTPEDVEYARLFWDLLETTFYNFPKKDRASMAYTLDSRAAYYSTDLIAMAIAIPREFKYHKGIRKYILRRAFKEDLPETILWREKKPFKYPGYKNLLLEEIFKEIFLERRLEFGR